MKFPLRSLPRLSLLALALVATTATASEVESWGGQIWLDHETDVFALPHRALGFSNSATVVYVPPTTTLGDFRAVSSGDNVGGVLTFGKKNWQGIIGANVPLFFNPLQAHGMGTDRGWGKSLVGGEPNEFHLIHGIDPGGGFGYDPRPTGRLHLGAAFQATDALEAGVTFQRFGEEWTEETTAGTNPTEKSGYDVSGFNLGVSGGWDLGGALDELELALTYGKGDKEQFNPDSSIGGQGDASTFSIAGIGTFDDFDWISSKYDLDYLAYLRLDRTSSDFTFKQPGSVPTAAPKEEADYTGVDARIGVAYQNGGFKLGTSAGIKRYTDEVIDTAPAGRFEDKLTVTRFPCCDFAGDIPIWKGLGFQYGVMVAWESQNTKETTFDAGGTQTNKLEEEDKGVTSSYHAGLLWNVSDDWRITATLDTDQLGDPGGAVFGNNSDAPFIAVGARVKF